MVADGDPVNQPGNKHRGSPHHSSLGTPVDQPLTNLSAEIDAITPQNDRLQTLTVPKQPLEVHKVAQSFNQLLGRQYQVMQREKEFIANASHELKTPLPEFWDM